MGRALGGRWAGTRYVLGPWSWLVIVYEYDAAAERSRVCSAFVRFPCSHELEIFSYYFLVYFIGDDFPVLGPIQLIREWAVP